MPDDARGEGIHGDGVAQSAITKTASSQTPPDRPPATPAQGITNDNVGTAVHAIEDRIKHAEWLMIGLTAGIVLLTLGLVVVGVLQWRVMSGQLAEMKASGDAATNQLWQAIGNMNWTARVADASLDQNRRAMAAGTKQNERSLAAAIKISETDQRAWLAVLPGVTDGILDSKGLTFTLNRLTVILRNTGRTPAIRVTKLCCVLIHRDRTETAPLEYDTAKGFHFSDNQNSTFTGGQGAFPPGAIQEEIVIDSASKISSAFKWGMVGNTVPQLGNSDYIVGKITYNDVFDRTRTHTTKLCLVRKFTDDRFRLCPSGTEMN